MTDPLAGILGDLTFRASDGPPSHAWLPRVPIPPLKATGWTWECGTRRALPGRVLRWARAWACHGGSWSAQVFTRMHIEGWSEDVWPHENLGVGDHVGRRAAESLALESTR